MICLQVFVNTPKIKARLNPSMFIMVDSLTFCVLIVLLNQVHNSEEGADNTSTSLLKGSIDYLNCGESVINLRPMRKDNKIEASCCGNKTTYSTEVIDALDSELAAFCASRDGMTIQDLNICEIFSIKGAAKNGHSGENNGNFKNSVCMKSSMFDFEMNNQGKYYKSQVLSASNDIVFYCTKSAEAYIQPDPIQKGSLGGLEEGNINVTRNIINVASNHTALLPTEVKTRVLHTMTYCPAEPTDRCEPFEPLIVTSLVPYDVNRFGVLRNSKKHCAERKGLFYKIKRRFRSALKQAKQDNDRVFQFTMKNLSRELDELKERHEEEIRIYRKKNYNHNVRNRLRGVDVTTNTFKDIVVLMTEGMTTSTKAYENGKTRTLNKLESKAIKVQRLNLQRVHKFEKKLLKEQLDMEKYHMVQAHNMILKNFDSLKILKCQFKNIYLRMQEGKMLWRLDDTRRKLIYSVIENIKQKIKENEISLLQGKRNRKKIRQFITKKKKVLEEYYKRRRKTLRDNHFYKTFISDEGMQNYTRLLEQLNEREERDFNHFKYTTLEAASEARSAVYRAYELRDLYRIEAKDKLKNQEQFLKEYAKWNEKDYQSANLKALKEAEDNIAREKSKLVEKLELELAYLMNKSHERISEQIIKHETELNEFDKLKQL